MNLAVSVRKVRLTSRGRPMLEVRTIESTLVQLAAVASAVLGWL